MEEKENKSTVLDILREIIVTAQEIDWPKEIWDMGSDFTFEVSDSMIEQLFSGLRKIADNNMFLHSHDVYIDSVNNRFASYNLKDSSTLELISEEYYGLFENMPNEYEPGTTIHVIWNDCDIHVFYSRACGTKTTDELMVFFNGVPITIYSSTTTVHVLKIPIGVYDIIGHVEASFLKENYKAITEEDLLEIM